MIGKMSSRFAGLALAGAMALAHAAHAQAEDEPAAESSADVLLSPWSHQLVYGDLVTDRADPALFDPKYDLVLYLQFDSGAHVTAKHAFFATSKPFPGTTEEQQAQEEKRRVICAINSIKLEVHDNNCPVRVPTDGSGPIFHDFEHFRFGSQQRLYVFVDNKDVAFNLRAPMSFGPFGAYDTPSSQLSTATKHGNYSFYNARYLYDIIDKKDVLVVDNYFWYAPESLITEARYNRSYSTNINLLVCRGPGKDGDCDFSSPANVLPLVIDPDTGNGWGYGP